MVKKNFKASKIRKNTWSWGIYSTRNFISDLWPLEDRQKRILLNNFVVFSTNAIAITSWQESRTTNGLESDRNGQRIEGLLICIVYGFIVIERNA